MSAPSPRQETMPIPVIHVSRRASAIGGRLYRQTDTACDLLQIAEELLIGKRHQPERNLGIANQPVVAFDFRLRDRKAGAFMLERRAGDQRRAGLDEGAQLRLLEGSQERHSGKFGQADDQPARCLRHRLHQQHAGHQRHAGEMSIEDRGFRRNVGLGLDRTGDGVDGDDAVDESEILELHANSSYAFFAATSSSMRVLKFSSTKYCSVVARPSLTSCVHCSSGILIPNVLSMANAMSRKSRLSIPRSLIA